MLAGLTINGEVRGKDVSNDGYVATATCVVKQARAIGFVLERPQVIFRRFLQELFESFDGAMLGTFYQFHLFVDDDGLGRMLHHDGESAFRRDECGREFCEASLCVEPCIDQQVSDQMQRSNAQRKDGGLYVLLQVLWSRISFQKVEQGSHVQGDQFAQLGVRFGKCFEVVDVWGDRDELGVAARREEMVVGVREQNFEEVTQNGPIADVHLRD